MAHAAIAMADEAMKGKTHYVPLVVVEWTSLNVTFDKPTHIGMMPVYDAIDKLRHDYPKAPYICIEPAIKRVRLVAEAP